MSDSYSFISAWERGNDWLYTVIATLLARDQLKCLPMREYCTCKIPDYINNFYTTGLITIVHGAENTTLSTSSMYHRYIRVIHLCMYGPTLTSCQQTTAHAQLILSRDHATRNACAFLIIGVRVDTAQTTTRKWALLAVSQRDWLTSASPGRL